MEKLIGREEQALRNSFMLWVILAAMVLLISGLGVSFYQQFYLHKPAGDHPMSDNGLLWTGIATIVVVSLIFVTLLKGTLTTEIWTDGIRYKFPPLVRNMRFIPLQDIASAEVIKYRPIIEFGGWGWRKRLFQRKSAYNVSGRIGIRILLKNGSQVMLGTQQKEEMDRNVKRMMHTELNKFTI